MKVIRRFVSLFQNSPTFGRDRASLISGTTIGLTALILNGAILMVVAPLMMDPNDRDIRQLTERLEFGQLLGLILLGGAAAFATFLIPLRLASVFLAPRVGRYFDQIVLSGISPFRFMIGKVTSQNLFVVLILFLLLPWFVLVLALGGLQWTIFLGNLFLVWLYCMMLALVMLWLSLYMNEVLAALTLIYFAIPVCGLGCAPLPVQPFVITPFPALVFPIYAVLDLPMLEMSQGYGTVFLSCVFGMTMVGVVSLCAISVGPLYGIIRDNSTFGEVVRAGDSRRKRRFRFRLHIQRPSEIAFFYENRSDRFRRYEGLLRWGTGFLALTAAAAVAWLAFLPAFSRTFSAIVKGNSNWSWWVYDFHAASLVIHGAGLLIAAFLFSHPRNSTFQRVPLMFGKSLTVSSLDTLCFGGFLVLSSLATVGITMLFDEFVARPLGITMFPNGEQSGARDLDFLWISREGPLVLCVAAVTVYLLQRTVCLTMWLKSAAMVTVSVFYLFVVCILPFAMGAMLHEVREFRDIPVLYQNAETIALMSPFAVVAFLFRELGGSFGNGHSTAPFYVFHAVLCLICLLLIRKQVPGLKREYMLPSPKEQQS